MCAFTYDAEGACLINSALGGGAILLKWFADLLTVHTAEWLTAAATVLLTIIAAIQLRAINRTSAADFVHRLNGDFYTTHTRKIRELLTRKAVTYQADKENPRFLDDKGSFAFDSQDLDDYVLGPLEAIGIYEKQKIIDLATTYEMFGWYVTVIWEDAAVQEYIKWQRSQPQGFDVYDCLEGLYRKCIQFRQDKQASSPRK